MKRPAEQEFSDIELAAAYWFARRDGGLTAEEEKEFDRWVAGDARHAEVYGELDETWFALGNLRRSKAGWRGRNFPWKPAILAAAAGFAVAASAWLRPASNPAAYAATATTGVGDFREMNLPDGSVIRLNTNTRIIIGYTAAERRVALVRGEAHFRVAKNPRRPFIVTAVGVAVRAVGTGFDVRMDSSVVEVLVTDGKVTVSGPAKPKVVGEPAPVAPPILLAGQKLAVPIDERAARPAVAALPPDAVKRAMAWQERRLEFDAVPLAKIVEEFNRYNTRKLVVADPALAQMRFGGTFPADNNEALIRLLERNFGVTVEIRENEAILRLSAP